MLERLTLVRHAKAIPATLAQLDKARSLDAHGVKHAYNLGVELQQLKFRPNVVLCSSAVRTRETLTHITGGYERSLARVTYLDSLYGADAETLLEEALLTGKKHVMLVGHNPGVLELVNQLAGRNDRLPAGYKLGYFAPCSLASFRMTSNITGEMDMFISTAQFELASVA